MTLKKTPERGMANPSNRVIDLVAARLQKVTDGGLVHTYAEGERIVPEANSAYLVLTGTVTLIQNIPTTQGNRVRTIREFGPRMLFNATGLIGRGSALPGATYTASTQTTIVEFPRERLKESNGALELLKALLSALIEQTDKDHREISYLVTQGTRHQAESEAIREVQLADLQEEIDEKEAQISDLLGRQTLIEANLRSTTESLDGVSRVRVELQEKLMEQLHKIDSLESSVARLTKERDEARKEAGLHRQQNREAFVAFQTEHQWMQDFWKNFEKFAEKMQLPDKMKQLLLGLSDEPTTTAENEGLDGLLLVEEGIDVDITELEPVVESIPPSEEPPTEPETTRIGGTAAYPVYRPEPTPERVSAAPMPLVPKAPYTPSRRPGRDHPLRQTLTYEGSKQASQAAPSTASLPSSDTHDERITLLGLEPAKPKK